MSGIKSQSATTMASESAYGKPRANAAMKVATPAMPATTSWPPTYPPMRTKISSEILVNLSRREAGTKL